MPKLNLEKLRTRQNVLEVRMKLEQAKLEFIAARLAVSDKKRALVHAKDELYKVQPRKPRTASVQADADAKKSKSKKKSQ